MLKELSEDNLSEIVSQNAIVLVQYSAGWCGNCRIMKPKFKKKSLDHENIPFVIVDSEKFPASRKLADVSNLPTFAYFREGKYEKQIQTNKSDLLMSFIDEATSN